MQPDLSGIWSCPVLWHDQIPTFRTISTGNLKYTWSWLKRWLIGYYRWCGSEQGLGRNHCLSGWIDKNRARSRRGGCRRRKVTGKKCQSQDQDEEPTVARITCFIIHMGKEFLVA